MDTRGKIEKELHRTRFNMSADQLHEVMQSIKRSDMSTGIKKMVEFNQTRDEMYNQFVKLTEDYDKLNQIYENLRLLYTSKVT